MRDRAYEQLPFRPSEIEHRYGPNVHILANPYLLSQLALLCARETTQPAINRLVTGLCQVLAPILSFTAHEASEVLGKNPASPWYTAVMEWLPTPNVDVLKVATPPLNVESASVWPYWPVKRSWSSRSWRGRPGGSTQRGWPLTVPVSVEGGVGSVSVS